MLNYVKHRFEFGVHDSHALQNSTLLFFRSVLVCFLHSRRLLIFLSVITLKVFFWWQHCSTSVGISSWSGGADLLFFMDNGEVTEFGGVSRQLAVQSVNSVISPVVFQTIFNSLYIPTPTPISAQLNVVRDACDTSLACFHADTPQPCIAWV